MEKKIEDTTYKIDGLSCANCASKFERNVQNLPGVTDAKVNFGASKISVEGTTTIEELEKAGAFENLKLTAETSSIIRTPEPSGEDIPIPWYKKYTHLLISSFLIIIGYVSHFVNGEMNIVTILLFLSAVLVSGIPLLITGIKNLMHFDFDMQSLMTIAVIGGVLIGQFGEVAVVVVLFALSEELESFSMDRARDSIRSLMDITPNKARVIRDGQTLELPIEDIRIGDIMQVKPGEKIAMDGVIISGASSINQAAITGESVPVFKEKDDEVFQGTLNENSFLEVEVTKLAEDTTFQKIIHLVEEAQGARAPSEKFIDTFSKYYTPTIIIIAILVAVIPMIFFNVASTHSIYQGLAVLLVGCPCALVISTPISIVSAIGNAANKGVLIKGGIYLEEMSQVSKIAFDKTGTLTKGIPFVTDINGYNNYTERELFEIIAALESRSQHPLSQAILRKADQLNIHYNDVTVEGFDSITGHGITGTINDVVYFVGNLKLLKKYNVNVDNEIENDAHKLEKAGKTVMILSDRTNTLGMIALEDEVRESAKLGIETLKQYGVNHTIMLTGDNEITAQRIASTVGVSEVQASLLPEEKMDYINTLRNNNESIAMVGDGVNDAPALAASNVGVAIGAGATDTALETADIAILSDDLNKLPFLYKLSKKTLTIIKENIGLALILKLIALLLVIPGWLTLWIAIAADMGTTLLVALNGLRLMRFKE